MSGGAQAWGGTYGAGGELRQGYLAGSCLGLGCGGGQRSREREIGLPSGPEVGIGLVCQIRAARAAGEQMFQVECALHTRSGGTRRLSVAREQHSTDLE